MAAGSGGSGGGPRVAPTVSGLFSAGAEAAAEDAGFCLENLCTKFQKD